MYSTEESVKQLKKQVTAKNGKTFTKEVTVPDFEKNIRETVEYKEAGKSITKDVFIRKTKPVKQVINLSEEAYEYMISSSYPYGFKGSWDKLSRIQKVRWHCLQIAEGLGGKLISFHILD